MHSLNNETVILIMEIVMFLQTLEQSMNAKANEHDRPIRPGTTRCKIGYGKSQPSNRLWIGGLGPWTSAEYLAKAIFSFPFLLKK